MTASWLAEAGNRFLLSLTTVPNFDGSLKVAGITAATTALAGLVAVASGFINPAEDYDFQWSIKPILAFFFPSLFEELLWRGILIAPHPSTVPGNISSQLLLRSGLVLAIHVLFHPLAGYTIWPRGRKVFCDWRFLVGATIVLGGATASYLVSGGSVWAAAFTHGLPVALWRDFFGGEALLMNRGENDDNSETN